MEGILLGVGLFFFAGLGIFSFMTGKSISDLWGILTGSIAGGSSYLVNMYSNYWTVLKQGINFNGGWGIIILAWAVVIFIGIMVLNFLTSRNQSFVQ